MLIQASCMLNAVHAFCAATDSNATLMLCTKMAAVALRMIALVFQRRIT
jgi:hypothetical protein